jgi:hypothetical protein
MFPCPHCGEPLPDGAESCPWCGADDETGWHPDADALGLDLPEGEDEEKEENRPPAPDGPSTAFTWFLICVGAMGLVAIGGWGSLANPAALISLAAVVTGLVLAARAAAKRSRRSS